MKAKNNTGQEVLVRTDGIDGLYIWKVIVPGGIIDIPEQYAKNLGFDLDDVTEEIEVKPLDSSIGNVKVETKVNIKDLERDIDKIKGIGPKRLKQISEKLEENLG
jgi:hypothetical protein